MSKEKINKQILMKLRNDGVNFANVWVVMRVLGSSQQSK